MDIVAIATKLFNSNGMVFSFMLLGIIMYFAYKIGKLTHGRIHGSAIAIFFGQGPEATKVSLTFRSSQAWAS
mgnify:CR=1 FL=1